MKKGLEMTRLIMDLSLKEVIDSHSEIKDGFAMWSEDEKDGRQRVGPGSLIPMLTKAIQELSQQVEELKAKVGE